jgi:hypothetical protein
MRFPVAILNASVSNLDKLQGAFEVSDSLIKNDRAKHPVSISRQFTLKSLTSIHKTNMSCRRSETAATMATTTRHLQCLSRIDQIRVVDVVMSCNLLKRAVESSSDASKSIALLDCDGRRATMMATCGPTEASSVVFEDLVEGNGCVLVVSVLALTRSVQNVVAVSIESDISR